MFHWWLFDGSLKEYWCNIDETLMNSVQTLMIISVFHEVISKILIFHWWFVDDSSKISFSCKTDAWKITCKRSNFACGLHLKRPHTKFTSVTCNLHVNTSEIIACTNQRHHANYTGRRPNIESKIAFDWYIWSIFIRKTIVNMNRHI